jgi:hypothetical protein
MPVSTLILGAVFFVGFAIRTPLTSKLYKELGYSLIMGAGLSYTYVHQQKLKYHALIDDIYDKVKLKFASNPILSTMREDEQIIKNFGFTKFADFDDSDDDEDPDNEGMRELGIFEGDPTKEKDEYRQRVLDHFYG